jgi:hypothetical protein
MTTTLLTIIISIGQAPEVSGIEAVHFFITTINEIHSISKLVEEIDTLVSGQIGKYRKFFDKREETLNGSQAKLRQHILFI